MSTGSQHNQHTGPRRPQGARAIACRVRGENSCSRGSWASGQPAWLTGSSIRRSCMSSARVLLLHASFTALGLCSFALSNALWAEMSALYRRLPEGDRLAAYMIVCLQLANVVPAFIMTRRAKEHQPGAARRSKRKAPVYPLPRCLWLGGDDEEKGGWVGSLEGWIWVLLVLGLALCLLLAGLWRERVGAHSLGLLLLTFCIGCVNNSSGLALYPFVSRFPAGFTSSLATGEGLSGVLVALLATAQNAGGRTVRFSVGWYFLLVAGLVYGPALLGFLHLLRHRPWLEEGGPVRRRRKEHDEEEQDSGLSERLLPPPSQEEPCLLLPHDHPPPPLPPPAAQGEGEQRPLPRNNNDNHEEQQQQQCLGWRGVLWRVLPALRVQLLLSALAYGAVPALLPLAASGYPHQAHVLQYSSLVSMTTDPLARFATHYLRSYRLHTLLLLEVVLAGVLVWCAASGPRPPLHDVWWGGGLVVAANGLFSLVFAFASTMVYLSIRPTLEAPPSSHHDKELHHARGGGHTRSSSSSSSSIPVLLVVSQPPPLTGHGTGHDEGGQALLPPPPPSRVGSGQQQQQQDPPHQGGGAVGQPDAHQQAEEQWPRHHEGGATAGSSSLLEEGYKLSAFTIQLGALLGSLAVFALAVSQ